MIIGTRFEFRNRNSKLIDCEWKCGNIEFLNCYMNCYSNNSYSVNWETAKFTGFNTFPVIKFDNCSLLGKHHYRYNTEGYNHYNSISYVSCSHSLLQDIDDLFAFTHYPETNFYNFGAAPAIKIETFKVTSDKNKSFDTTVNGTIHSKTLLTPKILSIKDANGGFPKNNSYIGARLPLGSIITKIILYCPPGAVTSGWEAAFTVCTHKEVPTILATTINSLKP